MAKRTAGRRTADNKRKIEHYTHPGKKRVNNPPVGLVTSETDHDEARKTLLRFSP